MKLDMGHRCIIHLITPIIVTKTVVIAVVKKITRTTLLLPDKTSKL